MAATTHPLIVIQMIGPEGCGKSTLSRLLYLYFLDHPFEHQLPKINPSPPELDHPPPDSTMPTRLHWNPNVPRWLSYAENPQGYTAAVKAALSRKYNAAGEPPVTHLILDSTHVWSRHRPLSFDPPKEARHSTAVWLYCYFTSPTDSLSLQAKRCQQRKMLPSHPPSVAHMPWSSSTSTTPLSPVEKEWCWDVMNDTGATFRVLPLPEHPLSSVEKKGGGRMGGEGRCTVGVVKVNSLVSVSESCQCVLHGLDQLLQHWGTLSFSPLSLHHKEKSKTLAMHSSLHDHDVPLCPSLPCSWRPYWCHYPLSLSSIGPEGEKSVCDGQEKRDDGASRFPPSPTAERSVSAIRREHIAMAYNHYRHTILGVPWTESLLYASVSLLSDSDRSCVRTIVPSHPSLSSLSFFPSEFVLETGTKKNKNKRETKGVGWCGTEEGERGEGTAPHPFFSLLRWVPTSFLHGKCIASEFHVTLRFLANGVDPFCIAALGEEVKKSDSANQEREGGVPLEKEEEEERGEGTKRKESKEEKAPQQGQERKEEDVNGRPIREKRHPSSSSTLPSLLQRCMRPPFYRCFYDVVVKAVVSDPKATAMLIDPFAAPAFPPCSNSFPHITIATAPGVLPSYSNVLLYEALERKRSPVTLDKHGTFERFIFWCDRQEVEKVVIPSLHGDEENTKAVAKPEDDKPAKRYEIARGSGPEGPKETKKRQEIKEEQRDVQWRQANSAAFGSCGEEIVIPEWQGIKDREESVCNGEGEYFFSSHPQRDPKGNPAEEKKKTQEDTTHRCASDLSPCSLPTFCGVLCLHTCGTRI